MVLALYMNTCTTSCRACWHPAALAIFFSGEAKLGQAIDGADAKLKLSEIAGLMKMLDK